MKIREILKLGAVAGAVAFPPLAAALPLINAFLPPDKQLDGVATGNDILAGMAGLPQDKQDYILDAEIDLEKTKVIEHSKIQQSLAAVDLAGKSTRPMTVTKLTNTICYVIILVVTMWAVAILAKELDMVKMITDGWPMILAIITPMLAVVRSYFGMRTDEKNTRQHMAHGHSKPLAGMAALVGAMRGK